MRIINSSPAFDGTSPVEFAQMPVNPSTQFAEMDGYEFAQTLAESACTSSCGDIWWDGAWDCFS